MIFKVIWGGRAKESLASIWLKADDKAAINAAVQQIDRFLIAIDPKNGTQGYRIAIAKPWQ